MGRSFLSLLLPCSDEVFGAGLPQGERHRETKRERESVRHLICWKTKHCTLVFDCVPSNCSITRKQGLENPSHADLHNSWTNNCAKWLHDSYDWTTKVVVPLVKLVHSLLIISIFVQVCMYECALYCNRLRYQDDGGKSLISEAESVSMPIYESSQPISQPPPSHQADPIFTLLMTHCLC